MNSNTPSGSSGDSPERPTPPPRLPKFEWPARGQDCPRLSWPQYLRLWSEEIDRACGGETGHYLGNWFLSLALQAESLQAHSPADHQTKATLEAEREAAWAQVLMDEAASPGVWVITATDDGPDGTVRGYFATDMNDETWVN